MLLLGKCPKLDKTDVDNTVLSLKYSLFLFRLPILYLFSDSEEKLVCLNFTVFPLRCINLPIKKHCYIQISLYKHYLEIHSINIIFDGLTKSQYKTTLLIL